MQKIAIFKIALLALFVAALGGCASPKKGDADTKEAAAMQSGTVTVDVDLSHYPEGQAVRLWLPVPKSNDVQTIRDVVSTSDSGKTETAQDAHGNAMFYVEWGADAPAAERKAKLSFHVERREIRHPELKEEGEVPEAEKKYLEEEGPIVLNDEIRALSQDITRDQTAILAKARAIYDWVIANMVRDNDVKGCGTGDVCTLIHTKAGKCTDINSVFVALCRAAGVPAREMFGVRINDQDITKNQHCWAEFFLPGTGWVVADPADVLKAVLTNKWSKDSEETKKLQAYYFGNCDAKRVELSRGRNLTLEPAQTGAPLNNFGYPYAEVDGKPIDAYSPDTFIYTISFEAGK